MKTIITTVLLMVLLLPGLLWAGSVTDAEEPMSLLTTTPAEGFQLALKLARLGVTETQPDRSILHKNRPTYSSDADSLIAASGVVAIHFQTIAQANDYWE